MSVECQYGRNWFALVLIYLSMRIRLFAPPPSEHYLPVRVPGWIKVMTRSLLDSDYVIQRAAMDGLLEDREKGIPALIQYITKNPQTRISNLASNELRKLGVQL